MIKKIKEKMINIIKFIQFINNNLENQIMTIIPLTKYFFKFRDSLFSYEMHEKDVFIKHMPKWYEFYEYNIFMRIFRVLIGLWLIFSRTIIPVFLELKFNIEVEKFIFFDILNLLILCFFFIFYSLKFILRFIYIKELVRNNPFSLKNCIIAGIKQLCYPLLITGGLGLGTNIIDVTSERHGYIPPFQHYTDSMNYYLNERVTKKIGTDDFNNLELYKGTNPLSSILRDHELRSLEKRKELIELYNRQEQGQQIRVESESVRKNI